MSITTTTVRLASVAALAATAALFAAAAPADAAVTGYRVERTGGAGLQVRTDPNNPSAPSVASLADGTYFTAECAQPGRSVSGNYVWHRISSPAGGWISDYYTNTPIFNRYAPGENDCRGANALAYARAVLGQSRTNGDLGDSNHAWNGWCDNFVAHAYGRGASGYATALDHYNALNARGMIHTDTNPPAGALTFYAGASVNGWAGHVQLSEGNGNFISTAGVITRVSISWPNAPYLGWAYANQEWPGR